MYVWRYRTIPPNLSPEWCEKRHLGPKTAKFNDRQYFRLYGITKHTPYQIDIDDYSQSWCTDCPRLRALPENRYQTLRKDKS